MFSLKFRRKFKLLFGILNKLVFKIHIIVIDTQAFVKKASIFTSLEHFLRHLNRKDSVLTF